MTNNNYWIIINNNYYNYTWRGGVARAGCRTRPPSSAGALHHIITNHIIMTIDIDD